MGLPTKKVRLDKELLSKPFRLADAIPEGTIKKLYSMVGENKNCAGPSEKLEPPCLERATFGDFSTSKNALPLP